MSKNNDYNIPMDELISEIEKELEEATTTGDVGGFDTPNAFSNGSQSDKKRKKKIATVLGYEMVGTVDETRWSSIKNVNEVISKEERSKYTSFSKKMKTYLKSNDLKGIKFSTNVSKSTKPNPYIMVVASDTIPNEFRSKVMKSIGKKPLDSGDINYGNITSKRISLRFSEWEKLLKGKITENKTMKKSLFMESIRETMLEDSEYQKFFKMALVRTGKKIPEMSEEEKKEFFNKIEKSWNSKGEKGKDGKIDESGSKIKMNNLDWGKTTSERNSNLDKFEKLSSEKEKNAFMLKLKGGSINEGDVFKYYDSNTDKSIKPKKVGWYVAYKTKSGDSSAVLVPIKPSDKNHAMTLIKKELPDEEFKLVSSFGHHGTLSEGAMGDIDVIAGENDNFKSFAKEVLHDYPKLPKGKSTMVWLKDLWDNRTQRENIEEGNDSSAAGVFYAEDEKGYVQGDTVKFFKTYTGAKRYYMKFGRTPESDEYDRFGSHVMDKNFFQTHTHYDWKGNPGFKKVEKFVQESTISEGKSESEMKKDADKFKKELNDLKKEAKSHPNDKSLEARVISKTEQLKRVASAIRDARAKQHESVNETKFIAFYNSKQTEIEGNDAWDAKQKAIKLLKIPKSKQGLLAIKSAKSQKNGDFRFENLTEGGKGDIDAIAQESDDFKSFIKEVYKEYPRLPRTKATILWFEMIWDNRNEDINESNPKKGRKSFYTMNNIGSSKYNINTYDGIDTHKDGSPFYGIETFKNKKKYQNKISDLKKQGWIEESTINEVGGYKIKANSKKIIDLFVKGYFKDAVSAHKGGAWFVDLDGGRKILRGPSSIVAEYKNGKLIIGTSYGNVSQTVINYITKFAKKNGIETVSKNLDEGMVWPKSSLPDTFENYLLPELKKLGGIWVIEQNKKNKFKNDVYRDNKLVHSIGENESIEKIIKSLKRVTESLDASLNESRKPNKESKKKIKSLFKLKAEHFNRMNDSIYFDKTNGTWWFIDSAGDLMELKNTYYLKDINDYINKNNININESKSKPHISVWMMDKEYYPNNWSKFEKTPEFKELPKSEQMKLRNKWKYEINMDFY